MLFFPLTIFGQEFPSLVFKNFSVKDGLSHHSTTSIVADNNGIIWIGTLDGLNRYNPSGFKIYRNIPNDSTSLPDNYIEDLKKDSNGNIWVASRTMLSRLNPKTGKFQKFPHETLAPNHQQYAEIKRIFVDKKDNVWIATYKGIIRLNPKTGKITKLKTPTFNDASRQGSFNKFNNVFQDNKGQLWAGNFLGLYKINAENNTLTFYDHGKDHAINAFYDQGNGKFYLGSWYGGLLEFDTETKKFNQIFTKLFNQNWAIISDIAKWKDNSGNDWFCLSTVSGFVLMNPKTKEKKEYVYDVENANSFNGWYTHDLFIDKDQRIWQANSNGISIINPNFQNFNSIPYVSRKKNLPEEFGIIDHLYKGKNEMWFTSWFSKGLYTTDRNWNITKHFNFKKNDIEREAINSYFVDRKNQEWLCTDGGLLLKKGENTFQTFKDLTFLLPNEDKNVFEFKEIVETKEGLFWLKTRSRGIYLFDPEAKKFLKRYPLQKDEVSSRVFHLFLDENQTLWAATATGIFYFDSKIDDFISIKIKGIKNNETFWARGFSKSKSLKNVLWTVSKWGLVKINIQQKTANLEAVNNDFIKNSGYNVLEDDKKVVWISNKYGLARYDLVSKKMSLYDYSYGLPMNFDNWGFLEYDLNNNIAMSNSGMITTFNPKNFKINLKKPKTILLDFSVNHQAIDFCNSDIKLPKDTKVIQILFSNDNFTAPSQNQYQYKLDEDSKWQNVPDGKIMLASLPAGNYTLQMKSSNNEGIFSDVETLSFQIKPYWYNTWLFRGLVLLALGTFIFYFAKMREQNLKNKAIFQQQLSELEMQLLRNQMNPHFIFNTLNSINSYIIQHQSKDASNYLTSFSKLMRQILDNSKQKQISLDKELQSLKLYLELESVRLEHRFSFIITTEEFLPTDTIKIPPLIIQPFAENSIWHGLRFLDHQGLLEIHCKSRDAETLLVIIKDNGIGRKKSKQISNNLIKKKSYGIDITKERLKILDSRNDVEIEDLVDLKGNSTGTKVILTIKINNDD